MFTNQKLTFSTLIYRIIKLLFPITVLHLTKNQNSRRWLEEGAGWSLHAAHTTTSAWCCCVVSSSDQKKTLAILPTVGDSYEAEDRLDIIYPRQWNRIENTEPFSQSISVAETAYQRTSCFLNRSLACRGCKMKMEMETKRDDKTQSVVRNCVKDCIRQCSRYTTIRWSTSWGAHWLDGVG